MENSKFNLKTGELIALVAIAILNIIWIVCRVISFTGTIMFQSVAPVVMLVITVIYALYGYRKPHGNHVRYLILIYSVYMSSMVLAKQNPGNMPDYIGYVNMATVILSSYMAGRLDRYKQNLIISAVILVLQIIHIYPFMCFYVEYNSLTFINFFKSVGPISVWLAIAASYIVRFKPHKEAGIEEDKK